MVFIITGAAESTRNTVGRLLAETLGWDFIVAEDLRPPSHLNARSIPSPADADPTLRIGTLSAAIHFWIYDWRDVVVSCQMLTERERKQLSDTSSLVKIVCLETFHATGLTRVLDRSVRVVSSQFPARWYAAHDPQPGVLTVDSSRQVEEIVAEMTAVLIMRKPPAVARN